MAETILLQVRNTNIFCHLNSDNENLESRTEKFLDCRNSVNSAVITKVKVGLKRKYLSNI